MNWSDLLAVQGTLKSLLQYHTTVQKYQFIAKPVMKYIILIDSDVCMHICGVLSHSVLSNSATPWTVVHQVPMSMGILQTRILEWVAMPSSRESSQPRDWNMDLLHCRWFFTIWATREAPVCVYECVCVCVCVCVRNHYGKLDHKVKHADVLIILTHTFGVHYAVLKVLHDKIRKHGCQCLRCSLPLHASMKNISGIQGNKYMYSLLLALSITIIYL